MDMKKFLSAVMVLGLIVTTMSGCSSASNEQSSVAPADGSGEKIVITFGGTLPDDNPLTMGMYKFKEELETRSNGRFEVQVFPNCQMGSGREMLESCQIGNLTMVESSIGPLAQFDSTCTLLNLPYLFYTKEQVYDFMDNYEISAEMRQRVEEASGIKMLAFWENGWRQVTNSVRPINNVEDFKGLKIRVMENDVHIKTFECWGANPTPMAFGELFTALQQKTVDGQDNPVPNVESNKFYEVQKYLCLADQFYDPDGLFINPDFYNSIPEDMKATFDECVEIATKYQREKAVEADQTLREKYAKDGIMEVTTLNDEVKTQLLELAQPAYDLVKTSVGEEFYTRFMDTVNEIKAK